MRTVGNLKLKENIKGCFWLVFTKREALMGSLIDSKEEDVIFKNYNTSPDKNHKFY